MKKKACKNCKLIVEGEICPICKQSNFVTNWKGRIIVLDHKESKVAHKVNIAEDGEYAIKVV